MRTLARPARSTFAGVLRRAGRPLRPPRTLGGAARPAAARRGRRRRRGRARVPPAAATRRHALRPAVASRKRLPWKNERTCDAQRGGRHRRPRRSGSPRSEDEARRVLRHDAEPGEPRARRRRAPPGPAPARGQPVSSRAATSCRPSQDSARSTLLHEPRATSGARPAPASSARAARSSWPGESCRQRLEVDDAMACPLRAGRDATARTPPAGGSVRASASHAPATAPRRTGPSQGAPRGPATRAARRS